MAAPLNISINEDARKAANLRMLQRTMDDSISNILESATHVVLYQFCEASQTWEKSDVEGSMFLVEKKESYASSSYLLVILNRNSRENYPMELSAECQLQHSDPYLIFRHPQPNSNDTVIRGIWFPNANERISMNQMLERALQDLRNNPRPTLQSPPPPAAATEPATTNGHINHNNQEVDQSAILSALLSPVALGTDVNSSAETATTRTQASPSTQQQQQQQQHQHQPMLDKKSLQLALLSLIQDDRFLDLIHAQYLKVANARASRNNNKKAGSHSS